MSPASVKPPAVPAPAAHAQPNSRCRIPAHTRFRPAPLCLARSRCPASATSGSAAVLLAKTSTDEEAEASGMTAVLPTESMDCSTAGPRAVLGSDLVDEHVHVFLPCSCSSLSRADSLLGATISLEVNFAATTSEIPKQRSPSPHAASTQLVMGLRNNKTPTPNDTSALKVDTMPCAVARPTDGTRTAYQVRLKVVVTVTPENRPSCATWAVCEQHARRGGG